MGRSIARLAIAMLALNLGNLRSSAVEEGSRTVAQAAKRIDAQISQLEQAAGSADPSAGSVPELLLREIEVLRDKTIMIFGERRKQWDAANERFGKALTGLTAASQNGQTLTDLRATWTAMRSQYPIEALDTLPPLWTCSMHSEVIGREGVSCPICGMSLDPIYETQPQLTLEPIIRAEIASAAPLVVGKQAQVKIRLVFNKDGKPVHLKDLEVAHTQRIHLLIVDLSQTDYHHEHPVATGVGEYGFSFTPKRPGPYRVWADLKPVATRVQQYSIVDLPAATEGLLASEESENREAVVHGYTFRLTLTKSNLETKETVLGALHVTDPDGKPCKDLEVLMGAFGHFVGFCDNYSTVLHIHPVGPSLDDLPDARGGPSLEFYIRSNQPGVIRLFTQVKIDGTEMFPRFIVKVWPKGTVVPSHGARRLPVRLGPERRITPLNQAFQEK